MGLWILPNLKDAGYDYAEITISHFTALSEKEFEEAKKKIAQSSVPVEAGCWFIPGDMNLFGNWTPIEAYLHQAFLRAAQLNLKIMVFGSGKARSIPEGSNEEETFQKLTALLGRIGDMAKTYGITIVIEPLNRRETNIVTSLADSVRLAKAVDHPNIKLLADYYHMAQEKDSFSPEAFSMLRHAHYADPVTRTYPVQLDEGSKAFFQQLQESGYAGRVSIEAAAPNGEEDLRRFPKLVAPWH